jgi:hypothetical protein
MRVKLLRVWYSSLPCWIYDEGPDTQSKQAQNVIMLASCHTEIKTDGGLTRGWIQAFDVYIQFDEKTRTLTVREAATL